MTGEAEDHVLNPVSDKRTLSDRGQQLADRNRLHNAGASLDPSVAEYLLAAHSDNTRRAYAADLKHFREWGGRIPSSRDEIACYLAAHTKVLNARTLRRRLAALADAHAGHVEDPTKSDLIARLMRGIVRRHETTPRQATPLLLPDLSRICGEMDGSIRALRDRALLLVGFFAALRRSEIAALEWRDIEERPDGLLLSISRSKTDQTGRGRQVFVPARTDALCPAGAMRAWARVAKGANVVEPTFITPSGRRMSDRTVARAVQHWAHRAGLYGRFSGHSLRAGFATNAALSGVDATLIARQTGHRSIQALGAYVRPTLVKLI